METFQSKKNQLVINEDNDGGIITGEDCDDAGIADERFASPDMFSTNDIMDTNGRKSLLSRGGAQGTNPIMLTSQDDNRLLAQCNDYNQIKKHLE
jgi:hypothetical protein